MLDNFLMAGEQTLIVFLLMAVGFFCGKKKIIDDRLADGLAGFVVNIAMVGVIILAFQREFEKKLVSEFLMSMIISAVGYGLAIAVAFLTFKKGNSKRVSVLRNAAIFPNVAMMALPMQAAMFGSDGVFCGAAHIAAFNLLFWPYCEIVLGGGNNRKALLKKIFLNPCVVATILGLAFFFTGIQIPKTPTTVLQHLSNLVLPLSMVILGQKLTRRPLNIIFRDTGGLISAAEKLVIVPLLMILLMKIFHIRGLAAICTLISIASPAAANVGMVAVTYGQDAELAASSVSVSTVLSLITMPLMIAVATFVFL